MSLAGCPSADRVEERESVDHGREHAQCAVAFERIRAGGRFKLRAPKDVAAAHHDRDLDFAFAISTIWAANADESIEIPR